METAEVINVISHKQKQRILSSTFPTEKALTIPWKILRWKNIDDESVCL